ncbi:hypothetical protein QBC33DRAFT_522254 [Phialemonium atrogriseum]|uniref:Uncharacterized protein n=1 Tax=Phialemonium atrogriseum TaxID=1093897 RepID=A0AAJ0CE82_9PEZI|nr:uncharacterized protein QBC33DRAFT_522254 [Phialemonium atrogriseum]KAK1772701.1 hypothetical protein QBC33DRAFT_522254 [Phialemonium atrogriseum]
MSARKYIPLALAIGLGIGNGYYAFKPSLEEQHDRKHTDIHSASGLPSQQPPEQGAVNLSSENSNSPASPSMSTNSPGRPKETSN